MVQKKFTDFVGMFFLFQGPAHWPGYWVSVFKDTLESVPKFEHLPKQLIWSIIIGGNILFSIPSLMRRFKLKNDLKCPKQRLSGTPYNHA
jgi:hypothetical protein